MTSLRLYKKEKLRSIADIDTLFGDSSAEDVKRSSIMAYPWRAVWRVNPHRRYVARFLISVPKKRLRHAVDRVSMRRRCREAYRLSRHLLPEPVPGIDIAFVYVGRELSSYNRTERSMHKMLLGVTASIESSSHATQSV